VIAPIHDQKVLDAADDEQLAIGDEAQNPRPKPLTSYSYSHPDHPLVRFCVCSRVAR
jgi:hypothetical protein